MCHLQTPWWWPSTLVLLLLLALTLELGLLRVWLLQALGLLCDLREDNKLNLFL